MKLTRAIVLAFTFLLPTIATTIAKAEDKAPAAEAPSDTTEAKKAAKKTKKGAKKEGEAKKEGDAEKAPAEKK